LLSSKTGLTALRLAEVQQPKVAATRSSLMSFCAFSAKVGQSEAPSSLHRNDLLAEARHRRVDLVDREHDRSRAR
jgi:hypothetical protein